MKENDNIRIIKQLYYGNHLEPKELKIAENIIYLLNISLKERIKEESK